MTNSNESETRRDLDKAQQQRYENVKQLMIEVLEKGIGTLVPFAINECGSDEKCGCRRVCLCKDVCTCE